MKTQFGASCFAILASLGLAACSGQIGDDVAGGSSNDPNNPNSTGTGGPQVIGPSGELCKPNASLAHARISVISDQQYINVARDVFGVKLTGDVSTVQSANGEYNVSESTSISSQSVAQSYLGAADRVVADPNFKPCGGAITAVTAACMPTWLKAKLPLAWRRPVTDDEVAKLMAVFTLGLDDSPSRAVQMTMEAALSSPNFLYREELGDQPTGPAGGSSKLSAFELASAVSFALANSSPDATLWAKAVDGSITQPAVLTTEVARLMDLQATKDNLQKKVSYYLNFEKIAVVSKDPVLFPEFGGIKDTLYQSGQMFLNDVLWKGKFEDLLTSRRMYANQAMAKIYGLPGVTSTSLVPVDTTGDAYNAGVLTQPLLLATANKHVGDDDIVHRGLYLYYNFACGVTLADPPADAASVFATLMGTPHQKAILRDNIAACGACHAAFDPFGLVTENYDPIGRYRTADPDLGGPIDTSTTIKKVGEDINGPVSGVTEMAQKLKDGRRASDCAATILTKFTLDHNADVENSCEIQAAKQSFHTSGSFPELFKAILTSPAFLTRDL